MNSSTAWFVIPLLFFICDGPRKAEAKSDFELVFKNFSCAIGSSEKMVKSLKCGLGKNSKRRTLQMEMSFAKDIPEFQMNILIVLPRKYDDFVLLNLTDLDGCNFLAKKNQVTLIHLGRSNLDQYSNFPKQCPLVGNKLYYIRGYRWNMDLLPTFPIETDAKIWFHYVANGRRLIEGFIECRLGLKTNKNDMGLVW